MNDMNGLGQERAEVVRLIVKDMEAYFRCFARADTMTLFDGEVEWITPKPSCAGPSIVFKADIPACEADRMIDSLTAGTREGRVPAWWVLTPESRPAALKQALEAKGYSCLGDDEPGMALRLQDAPAWPGPPMEMTVKRVHTLGEFEQWIRVVNTALHGWELLQSEPYRTWLTSEDMRFYLAEVDGKPAATSATIHNGSSGSIEFVSTLEEYRNRGAGTTVSVAALRGLQASGVEIATLRACHDAIHLYEKLGFQTYYHQILMQAPGVGASA